MRKLYYFFWIFLIGIQAIGYSQDDPQLEWAFNTTSPQIRGGESNGKEIVVDNFGKVFVVGYFQQTADFNFSSNTNNLTASGDGSIFLTKYESNGDLIWAKKIAGTSSTIHDSPDLNQGFNLALDSNGDVILSGLFSGTVDFNPGLPIVLVSSGGLSDVFLSKFDSNGNFVWVKTMGGNNSSYKRIHSLFLDNSNNIYIGGIFNGQADFNPSEDSNVLTAAEGVDGFFAKYSSSGNYVWAKSITGSQGDEYVNSISVDSGGNVFIAGNFQLSCDFNPDSGTNLLNAVGSKDAFIAKYTSSGSYLWAKQIGGTNTENVNALKLDPAGNIYVTGAFFETVDFDPDQGIRTLTSSGSGDIFIAKYNASGAYVWSKSIGAASYEEAFSLLLDNNNAIYITGWFFGTSDFDPGAGTASLTPTGYNDVFWAKYDNTGNYIWSKSLGGLNPGGGQHDTEKFEKGFSLALGKEGQVFLTGVFFGTADFNPGVGTVNITSGEGYANAFWSRFDSSGNYLNAVVIGGYGGEEATQVGVSVAQGSNGDVYSAGYYRGTADFDLGPNESYLTSLNSENTFIAKYSGTGGYLWAKNIGGQGQALVYTMVLDQEDNIYLSGSLSGEIDFDPGAGIAMLSGNEGDAIVSKVFIAKYDSQGNYIWAKAIGSSGLFQSMARDSNGNILISGHFTGTADFDPGGGIASMTSNGYDDAFIAKYDVNGNYVWAKRIGTSSQTITNSMVCDNGGNFYITGLFIGITDFDPGIGTAIYNTNNQSYNVFVVKYDPSGNLVWVKAPQGEGFDEAKTITVDPMGNLIVAGSCGGPINLNPGGINGTLTDANMFFVKYDNSGNYIWAKGFSGGIYSINANAVKSDALGNVYVVGGFTNIVDFNPDAQHQNVLMSLNNTDNVFLAKYDNNGNYLWARSVTGDGNASGSAISIKNNKLLLTGNFSGEADFDVTSGNHTLTCLNSSNMFLAKYIVCGNLDDTITVAGDTLFANAVAGSYQWIDCNNGGAFLQGETNQSFSPLVSGNYAVIITDNGCQVVSECHSLLGIDKPDLYSAVLYPNPTNGDFAIQLPRTYSEITLKITNLLGETISVNRFSGAQQLSLSFSQVSQGLYFVELNCDGFKKDFKVLKK